MNASDDQPSEEVDPADCAMPDTAADERKQKREDWAKEFLANIIHRADGDEISHFTLEEDIEKRIVSDVDVAVRYAENLLLRLEQPE